MNTNTLFSYDFTRRAIVASATTLKKTRNPESPECEVLMRMLAEHPDFCVVEKEIRKIKGSEYALTKKWFLNAYPAYKERAVVEQEMDEVIQAETSAPALQNVVGL